VNDHRGDLLGGKEKIQTSDGANEMFDSFQRVLKYNHLVQTKVQQGISLAVSDGVYKSNPFNKQ
jgi:hypothetical protein